jgi:hypothetical protein
MQETKFKFVVYTLNATHIDTKKQHEMKGTKEAKELN